MIKSYQMIWNNRVSCCSLLECTFFMIAKNLKTRTCSIVLDYPERHILFPECNGLVCKLWYSFMVMKCDNPAILLLMHYLLLWHGLHLNPVQCFYAGTTCFATALVVTQRKINYWDRHQGLDLGVQGHTLLGFNE